jgi:hypothetical protein
MTSQRSLETANSKLTTWIIAKHVRYSNSFLIAKMYTRLFLSPLHLKALQHRSLKKVGMNHDYRIWQIQNTDISSHRDGNYALWLRVES